MQGEIDSIVTSGGISTGDLTRRSRTPVLPLQHRPCARKQLRRGDYSDIAMQEETDNPDDLTAYNLTDYAFYNYSLFDPANYTDVNTSSTNHPVFKMVTSALTKIFLGLTILFCMSCISWHPPSWQRFLPRYIDETDAMMNVLDPTSVERPRTPPPPYPPPPTYEEAIANAAV